MRADSKTIIAIAPGKKGLAVAVLEGANLVLFRMKTLQNRHSEKFTKTEVAELIKNLGEEYRPFAIAVRGESKSQRTSKLFNPTLTIIKRYADENKIAVFEISPDEIKVVLGDQVKPTQKTAFQNLTDIYPELRQFLSRPNKEQNIYYYKLFAAISAGVVLTKLLSKKYR